MRGPQVWPAPSPRRGKGWSEGRERREPSSAQRVQRAHRPPGGDLQHVRVDHRRAHLAVAEQFLHRADVGARLQQVRGEAVTQRVRRYVLLDAGQGSGAPQCARQPLLEQVVAPLDAGGSTARARRGEDPVPGPRLAGTRVFRRQCVGQEDAGKLRDAIGFPQPSRACQLFSQRLIERTRQHHDPVLGAFAFTHHDHAPLEVQVLDPQ